MDPSSVRHDMTDHSLLLRQTAVSVWHWASYHSEANFLEPFSYRPERFLQDPKFANDKFDMLQPFSVGPRNCVGRKYVQCSPLRGNC